MRLNNNEINDMQLLRSTAATFVLVAVCVVAGSLLPQYGKASIQIVRLLPYALASTAFVAAYILVLRRRVRFVEVFMHELTHVIFVVLCLNRPESFNVDLAGHGSMTYTGMLNPLVRIAPYVFPVGTYALIVLSPLVFPQYLVVVRLVVVLTFVWYLLGVFQQVSPQQTDLGNKRFLLWLPMILVINAANCLLVVFFTQNTMKQFPILLNGSLQMWEGIWKMIR